MKKKYSDEEIKKESDFEHLPELLKNTIILRNQALEQLRWFDAEASKSKRTRSLLQTIRIIILTALPGLIIYSRYGGLTFVFAVAASAMLMLLESIVIFSNPGSKWELYRTVREEVRSTLFRIEMLENDILRQPSQVTKKKYDELNDQLIETLEKQQSLWYFSETKQSEAPSFRRRNS